MGKGLISKDKDRPAAKEILYKKHISSCIIHRFCMLAQSALNFKSVNYVTNGPGSVMNAVTHQATFVSEYNSRLRTRNFVRIKTKPTISQQDEIKKSTQKTS
jgi:hypothetical protein